MSRNLLRIWAAIILATILLLWLKSCMQPGQQLLSRPPENSVRSNSLPVVSHSTTNLPTTINKAAPNVAAASAPAPVPGLVAANSANSSVSPAGDDAILALPPLTVLDNCRVVIHSYHDRFGENPVGSNAEITAALRGQNPRQVNFLRDDLGLRLNEKGEMLDGYGTPFFFHQLSADRMEIRSAGQDRILFTFDDVVTR